MSPKVTVLLPVYNAAEFIQAAIDSILKQTFTDFELLIIEDGSSDSTLKIIERNTDSRIRLIKHNQNLGLIDTLNQGLELATGKYIARMDADDISLPDRLKHQVEFLDSRPEVTIVGGWSEIFGAKHSIRKVPKSHDEIKAWLLFSSMLIHPAVMFRKEVFRKGSFKYEAEAKHVEDYDLWSRLLQAHRAHNLQEVLLRYRVHQNKIGFKYADVQVVNSNKIRQRLLSQLGIRASEVEMELHTDLSYWKFTHSIEAVDEWLSKIAVANRQSAVFSQSALEKVLLDKWIRVFKRNKLNFSQRVNFIFTKAKLPGVLTKFKLLFA